MTGRDVLDFGLAVAFPLAVYTAAVSLVVEPHFFGYTVALPEAWPEVLVIEAHLVLLTKLLTHFSQQVVFLVRADEQGRGEGVESFFAGNLCCLRQPHTIAVGAAVVLVSRHSLKVFGHIVALGNDERQVRRSSEGLHSIQAELVLSKGLDIRVVPEGSHLVFFVLQGFHNIGRAGAAANVKENGRHFF